MENREKSIKESKRGPLLDNKHYVVDKLHIQNHVGKYCLENTNPVHYPELMKKLMVKL